MPAKVKLNFSITAAVETALDDYCAYTGRSVADVVRSVVLEWVEGDRELPKHLGADGPLSKRTNVALAAQTVAELEARLQVTRTPVSTALNALLADSLFKHAAPARVLTTLTLSQAAHQVWASLDQVAKERLLGLIDKKVLAFQARPTKTNQKRENAHAGDH